MKLNIRATTGFLSIGVLLLGASTALAGGGGGGGGSPGLAAPMPAPGGLWVDVRGSRSALTDRELTAVTRAEEGIQGQLAAVSAARASFNSAVFAAVFNPADVAAKLRALEKSEMENALGQADVYAKLAQEGTDPARLLVMRGAIGSAAGGGRGGGGGARGGGGAPATTGVPTGSPALGLDPATGEWKTATGTRAGGN